jgi:hypothetical protein
MDAAPRFKKSAISAMGATLSKTAKEAKTFLWVKTRLHMRRFEAK